MDPDETLARVLSAAKLIVGAEDADEDDLAEGAAVQVLLHHGPELAAAVLDLHAWIERGGFLPAAWRTNAAAS